MAGLQGALEDCAQDLKSSEEKWRQSVLEGVKVSEELQSEQQRFIKEESGRKAAEAAVAELKSRLEEVEKMALRGSHKALQRLEVKNMSLTEELESEQRGKNDILKNLKRLERRVKETEFQQVEDMRTIERLEVNHNSHTYSVKSLILCIKYFEFF